MKISEIITDKYKLRIPPTVYYDLLADVVEAEEEQEPTPKNDLGVDAVSRILVQSAISKSIEYKENPYQLYKRIERLPSVIPQEPKWIPVSERLPKAGEYVGNVAKYYLVQNEYGDMLVARYTHSEYWEQIYQLKPYTDEIVAWMPLPKGYSEVEP